MEYRELKKLSYGDPGLYEQEYRSRFNSEEAVRLNFFIGENQAFFLENREVLRQMLQIQRLDKEVLRLCVLLPGVAKEQYSKKCLIDEIVLTNNIEGVHSSRKEIGEALEVLDQQSGQRGKRQRFLSLVNKYLKLMDREKIVLESCQDVRNIYDELFLEEVKGENSDHVPDGRLFRKEMAEVKTQTGKVIHRGLYPEQKIMDAMDRALTFLHDPTVEKLYRICIFHYLIEYIHPFYDGNGRLGRFILSYGISKTLEPLSAYRISETIKENISLYYKAFSICNEPRNRGDLTPFLLMQLNMIYLAIQELYDSLLQRWMRWKQYEGIIDQMEQGPKLRQLYCYLIQAALLSENGISTRELMDGMRESYYMVKKYLDQLPDTCLIAKKKGKIMYYQIDLSYLDKLGERENRNME